MDILALKWNNHQNVFSHQISELRRKTTYTDATLACHGKFYQVHRLVLSTCSEYFSAIFNQTPCKNPVIVLKDIACRDLEFLLDYMYAGEVNVRQNDLSSLIGAAENLQIKGLAISDEEITSPDELRLKSKHGEMERSPRLSRSSGEHKSDTINDSSPRRNSSEGYSYNSNSESIPKSKERITNSKEAALPTETHINGSLIDFQSLYDADIKTEPNTEPVDYDSNKKDLSFTSSLEENSIQEDKFNLGYKLFSSETDITETSETSGYKEKTLNALSGGDRTVNILPAMNSKDSTGLVSPLLQDDTSSSHTSLDPHDMLPQGPFLQLPLSGIMGRSSKHNSLSDFERSISDNGTRDGDSSLVKKDYACSFCGRTFSHRTNQLAHERIHTGEKPFGCLYCPFRTALKGNLKNHVFSRHQADWKAIKHLIFPSNES